MARALFVTGTDTGVGKTRIAAGLVRSLRARGIRAVGFKPILCGEDRSDAEALLAASQTPGEVPPFLTLDEVNPVWLKSPVAPLAAPLLGETTPPDRRAILDTWEALSTRFEFVVIEGAGGWEVPLTATETFADLAKEFAAPVLVVAANRLGVLSHTTLTVDAVGRAGLACEGIVLNEIAPPDPDDLAKATNREALRLMFPGLRVEALGFGEELSSELLLPHGLFRPASVETVEQFRDDFQHQVMIQHQVMNLEALSDEPVFLKGFAENPMARIHRLMGLILGVSVALLALWQFVSIETFGAVFCFAIATVLVMGNSIRRQKSFALRSVDLFTVNGERNQPLPWRSVATIEISGIDLKLTLKNGQNCWLRLPFLTPADRQEAFGETLRAFEQFSLSGPLVFPSGTDFTFKTARLELRAAQERDQDFFVSIGSSKINRKFQLYGATTTEFDALRFQTQLEAFKTGGHFWLGVVVFKQVPVGAVSLTLVDPILRQGQIGIDLAEEFQNQGLGSEALKAWMDVIRLRTNLTKLSAGCFVENARCRRVLEKAGFSRVGTVEKFWVKDGEWKTAHWFEMIP